MEKSLARIALFAALIAALGLVPQITLPITGVPITAQSLGIMLAGLVLGPVRGALAVLLFLAVVAMGAPILSGGRGGLGVFAGPTVGFLVGFPVAAFAIGWVLRWLWPRGPLVAAFLAAVIGGIVVLYAFGIPGLVLTTDLSLVAAAAFALVYIPGDIAKAVIAALVIRLIARARPEALDVNEYRQSPS